jgi:hypothetical protein
MGLERFRRRVHRPAVAHLQLQPALRARTPRGRHGAGGDAADACGGRVGMRGLAGSVKGADVT